MSGGPTRARPGSRRPPTSIASASWVFVVADLELQFEFIQAQWIEKGDFIGLPSDEKDPLVGANGDGGSFTVPGADMPFLFDVRQFVTIQGGEYFFAPGLNALRGIAAGKF